MPSGHLLLRFGGQCKIQRRCQKVCSKTQFERIFFIQFRRVEKKGYDRFQTVLYSGSSWCCAVSIGGMQSQLSRALPSAWSSTNKVKSGLTGTFSTCNPSTSSSNIPEREAPAGFADEVIYSLFAKQSEDLDLLHEDLEQIDDVDIEEMDINWQIAMIAIRMKKFYKKTGRRVRIDGKAPKKTDSVYQDQEAGKQEQNQIGLLTMDDGVVNWGDHTAEEETNHALMAISSNNEVSLCSKTCIDSYNKLKTLCDEQMNQLGEQEAQILAYTLAVKKLEAQVVTFQKQQLSLNERLTFQANEIYAKDEKLK
ncbi:hypothetical protein Tco_0164053 [Tanacetum coccineum]